MDFDVIINQEDEMVAKFYKKGTENKVAALMILYQTNKRQYGSQKIYLKNKYIVRKVDNYPDDLVTAYLMIVRCKI